MFGLGKPKEPNKCASCGSTEHLKRLPAPPPRFWTYLCTSCFKIIMKNRKEAFNMVVKAKESGKDMETVFKEVTAKLLEKQEAKP